jgi:site-specific DNA-methyltransferase (adenine-specific)
VISAASLPTPYYKDDMVTLYCGDAVELLPRLRADAIVTDPPYRETSLAWDVWPCGWPSVAAVAASSMWCFGSLRMFMDRAGEFAKWKMSQDIVWEKHNGTNPFNDRFRRVHEHAAHFYQGAWAGVYKAPQFTNDATARTVRRKARPPQWGDIGAASYESTDGGPRLARSVIYVRSCHGSAIHPTQKPEDIIAPLLNYSVPPGGTVLDCFAGSGTVLVVARKAGRRAVGIEKNAECCAVAADRLSQAKDAFSWLD